MWQNKLGDKTSQRINFYLFR